ncbi:nuclear transport factor 2 family protein [Amycolatopsis rhabdoformis]|uniref:Nuclear transport factor 2 family protein n=1 Tax=Amycolatopsis rhabdoformis TaxID=1448059 RepID=A0ABZ1HZJ1_9PSEU|nr:nuclear transport factor 2 family protein [Amycolatopsis rhabdoformis]WSE27380.1 nuclear transport factor 2 family protein [Amycolatopsis rhabdoformis]
MVNEARLACEDVVRKSFRLIDDGHAGASADCYTADATLVMAAAQEVRAEGAQIRAAMRRREQEDRRTLHVVSPSSFELDADRAECHCDLQVFALSDPATAPNLRTLSRVHDVLKREDGQWLIAERRITVLAGGR